MKTMVSRSIQFVSCLGGETLIGTNYSDIVGDMGGLDPLMAIIYHYRGFAISAVSATLSFWVLLLTYMTNRFPGKIERRMRRCRLLWPAS